MLAPSQGRPTREVETINAGMVAREEKIGGKV
jgi:hypothetical protein